MGKKNRNQNGSGLIRGTLKKVRSGSGFVEQENGDDIFIHADNMKGAMNGDEVLVDLLPPIYWDKNPEGLVDRILNRNVTEVVGTYRRQKGNGFVESVGRKDDAVFIKKKNAGHAKSGDRVVCRITRYPASVYESPEGRITEIIARSDEAGAETKALIRSAGLSKDFPSAVSAQAARAAAEPLTNEEISRRRDLRERTIITIDGADSKDLDDAVSVEATEDGGYRLGVHIADVSHYVPAGSKLDREALKRGNSVYLLNHVIPMLPKTLSNGACSLFEGADRLTMTCEMTFDSEGKETGHEIYESIIRSSARMVYHDVSEILENHDPNLSEHYGDYNGRNITSMLFLMEELAALLRRNRMKHGSIDFDTTESEILLNDLEIPTDIRPAERRTANKLIEEFMLAANRTVAEHFCRMEVPFVYRIHEQPEPSRITEVKHVLRIFGLSLPGVPDQIHPAELARVLEQAAGKPGEEVVNTVILHAMSKARYSTECEGHFGLAFRYYCHFTSPIRRYPDLMVHRIIRVILSGGLDDRTARSMEAAAQEAAEVSSRTEREALELERDVEKMKKSQYMLGHLGEIAEGVISGVTEYGFYVRLPNTVEGLVRLESLNDDYYEFDPDRIRVLGIRNHRTFTLGDIVRIQVLSADPALRRIDFRLAEE